MTQLKNKNTKTSLKSESTHLKNRFIDVCGEWAQRTRLIQDKAKLALKIRIFD